MTIKHNYKWGQLCYIRPLQKDELRLIHIINIHGYT